MPQCCFPKADGRGIVQHGLAVQGRQCGTKLQSALPEAMTASGLEAEWQLQVVLRPFEHAKLDKRARSRAQ